MKRRKNFDLRNPHWKDSLPRPVFDEHPEYLEFYDRAWELAHDHVKAIPGMPQTPYMDEAFIESDIWIWDTCFMMFFCKYAPDVFPGIETLNNFYRPLHDHASLPLVTMADPPAWTGIRAGEPTQLKIHIPDNPPLFGWAEYSYALMTGDRAHLEQLLMNDRYLQRHFDFFEAFREPGWGTQYTRAPTCLVKQDLGYFWEGGRSGMDNTPRGRTGRHAEAERPNHPRMLWVDAISQQALAALSISRIALLLGKNELALYWTQRYEAFRKTVNEYYWDEADGMYYDLHNDTHEFLKCLTPASFWPLLACIPDADRVRRMAEAVTDPDRLGGAVPWTTVARNDPDFNPETGDYWRGAVWLPTAYMGIKGLENYGLFELANDSARKILDHMYRTYRDYEPHTVWECYRPNQALPAQHGETRVRPDFCGWSALGPLALFIENVIGLYSANAFTNTVKWALPKKRQGALGVRNYTFGDITFDLICNPDRTIHARSDAPFTLEIDGRSYSVAVGDSVIKLA